MVPASFKAADSWWDTIARRATAQCSNDLTNRDLEQSAIDGRTVRISGPALPEHLMQAAPIRRAPLFGRDGSEQHHRRSAEPRGEVSDARVTAADDPRAGDDGRQFR